MAVHDELSAVVHFKREILEFAKSHWPAISNQINKAFNPVPQIQSNNHAVFDFFLAALFLQTRTAYQIYGENQGSRIWQYLQNTFAIEPQFGGYAIETLETYLSMWNQCQKAGLNPINGVATIFMAHKLQHDKNTDGPLLEVIAVAIKTIPSWWEAFSKKHSLRQSDFPLDPTSFKQSAKIMGL